MDDTRKIKTMFSIDVVSIISDTADKEKGEASTGYEYKFDSSLPELAFSLAGFLKQLDDDEDVKAMMEGNQTPGASFITLLQAYYEKAE